MSVAAPRALAPATRLRPAPSAFWGPPGLLRGLAFGGLGLWGALVWARLVVPTSRPVLLAMAAFAAGLAVALARVPQRRGWGVAALAGGGIALVGVLALAGAPARTFVPAHWGELARGIGDGLGALPGATTPYRGADPWARTVLEAGGGILLVLGGIAWALLPPRSLVRDRALTALPLLAVAGVPAVVLPRQRVGEGVVLLVLLLAARSGPRRSGAPRPARPRRWPRSPLSRAGSAPWSSTGERRGCPTSISPSPWSRAGCSPSTGTTPTGR